MSPHCRQPTWGAACCCCQVTGLAAPGILSCALLLDSDHFSWCGYIIVICALKMLKVARSRFPDVVTRNSDGEILVGQVEAEQRAAARRSSVLMFHPAPVCAAAAAVVNIKICKNIAHLSQTRRAGSGPGWCWAGAGRLGFRHVPWSSHQQRSGPTHTPRSPASSGP